MAKRRGNLVKGIKNSIITDSVKVRKPKYSEGEKNILKGAKNGKSSAEFGETWGQVIKDPKYEAFQKGAKHVHADTIKEIERRSYQHIASQTPGLKGARVYHTLFSESLAARKPSGKKVYLES